jgi:class 3 adenylate cyclase/GAF domain-containing protein
VIEPVGFRGASIAKFVFLLYACGNRRTPMNRPTPQATELARLAALLDAVGQASARLVAAKDWRALIPRFLEDLGRAAKVSRVSLFETHLNRQGRLVQSCRYDWVEPPFQHIANAPGYVDMALNDDPDKPDEIGEWSQRRMRGEIIQARVDELTGELRRAFVESDTLSFISVPVMVHGKWWGFVGFDDGLSLRRWAEAEINVLRTAANLVASAIEREEAESETRRRAAMLHAIGTAAPRLVTESHWQADIEAFLAMLGAATEVSRVTLFETHRNALGHPVQSCRHDWAEPPLNKLSGDPRYTDQPLADEGQAPHEFGDWARRRMRGEVITALQRDLTGYDRQVFVEHQTLSFVSVPITSGSTWWGFLGFDDCRTERVWTTAEIDVLRSAAALIGGAIARSRASERLRLSEERYALAARGANDGLWDWQIAEDTCYFSPRLHEILGLPADTLGTRFSNFVDRLLPEDAQKLNDTFAQTFISGKRRFWVQCRLPVPEKGPRSLILRGLIVYDDFKPRRVVGSLRDITDWVESQERLREAEARRSRLARYFSPNMVDELMLTGGDLTAARTQTVSVLFADIMDFSRLSAEVPATDLIELLRQYLGHAEEAVFAHGGTLDKFLGDGLLATFGTPRTGPNDASNAIACARAIAARVNEWNERRRAAGLDPWRIGIGIHTGEAVLGDIGSERRMEFAVVGETVNTASRIESMTRVLDIGVLASDATIMAVRAEGNADALSGFADMGEHALRGRTRKYRLWGLAIETLR